MTPLFASFDVGNRAARMTRRGAILPMTSTAAPISATAKQQHQKNNDENQFHSKSPLRPRLQMEGTDRCELSSARLEFHYRPSWRRRMNGSIGIGGSLTAPPLPHHQDIRVRIRRFGRLSMSLR